MSKHKVQHVPVYDYDRQCWIDGQMGMVDLVLHILRQYGPIVSASWLRTVITDRYLDVFLLRLCREGRIGLHKHDYPGSLSDEERAELITDGHGTYYAAVSLREQPKDYVRDYAVSVRGLLESLLCGEITNEQAADKAKEYDRTVDDILYW